MAIGDAMSQTVPAVGTAGTGYASTLVTFLNEVKARLIAKVPLSSLLISALDMANNAITNLAYATLYAQVTTPPTSSLYNSGGNLFWVGSSGAVQITNGAVISSASLGGITGDYGSSNPARFTFVNADETFYAYDDEAGGLWARLWARSIDLTGDASGAERVRVTWGGSANYTLTLPAAPPGAQALLQMEADGDVVASNTIPEHITLAVDKNITLSGTGSIKHGEYSLSTLAAVACVPGAAGVTHGNGPQPTVSVTAGSQVNFHIQGLPAGKRITKLKVIGTGSGGSTAPTFLIRRMSSVLALNTYTHTEVLSGSATAGFEYTLTLDSPDIITVGHCLLLSATPAGGTTVYNWIVSVFTEP